MIAYVYLAIDFPGEGEDEEAVKADALKSIKEALEIHGTAILEIDPDTVEDEEEKVDGD